MAWTFQFPVTLFLTLLSSIVWHGHGAGRKKEKKKNAHTGVCSGTLRLTGQCCLVDVSPGNLFACNFKCMQRSRVCQEVLGTSGRKTAFGRRLVRISEETAFSPSRPSALFWREGNLRHCARGKTGGSGPA